jgi:hypothetical protein
VSAFTYDAFALACSAVRFYINLKLIINKRDAVKLATNAAAFVAIVEPPFTAHLTYSTLTNRAPISGAASVTRLNVTPHTRANSI